MVGGGAFPTRLRENMPPPRARSLGPPPCPLEFKAEFHASLIQTGMKPTLNCFGRVAGGVFHDFWGFLFVPKKASEILQRINFKTIQNIIGFTTSRTKRSPISSSGGNLSRIALILMHLLQTVAAAYSA